MVIVKWRVFAIGKVEGTKVYLGCYGPAFGTTAKFLISLQSRVVKLSCGIKILLIRPSIWELWTFAYQKSIYVQPPLIQASPYAILRLR